MNVETYDDMCLESAVDAEIEKAEKAYLADGVMLDASAAFEKLRSAPPISKTE